MRRSEAFPSQFLSKDDVVNAGTIRATIAGCEIKEVGMEDNAEEKPVLKFREHHIKPMPLNSTNWNVIEAAYGDDSDMWAGKVIEIFHDPSVMFKGKATGGTRIRIPAGAAPAATPVAAAAGPADVLSLEQAIATAIGAGMTKEGFIAAMKLKGMTGYAKADEQQLKKDTLTARAIISEFAFGQSSGKDEETIPF